MKADKDIVSEEDALLNYEQCEDWSKPNNAHEIVSYHKEMINSVNSVSNKNRCIILIQSDGSENEDECKEVDSSSKEIKKKMQKFKNWIKWKSKRQWEWCNKNKRKLI